MHLSFALLASLVGFSSSAARAQEQTYPLLPPTTGTALEPSLNCSVLISADPFGPDQLKVKCKGLIPGTSYTLYLGQSPKPGTTPVSFLGHFQADAAGKGKLAAQVEVTSAYIGDNTKLDWGMNGDSRAGDGIVDAAGAGALAAGGFTIPLPYIRMYQALPTVVTDASGNKTTVPTVFGIGPKQPGGLFVATTPPISGNPPAKIAPPPAPAPTTSSGNGANGPKGSNGATLVGALGGSGVALGGNGVAVLGGFGVSSTTSR